jgi:hypothetical protein
MTYHEISVQILKAVEEYGAKMGNAMTKRGCLAAADALLIPAAALREIRTVIREQARQQSGLVVQNEDDL